MKGICSSKAFLFSLFHLLKQINVFVVASLFFSLHFNCDFYDFVRSKRVILRSAVEGTLITVLTLRFCDASGTNLKAHTQQYINVSLRHFLNISPSSISSLNFESLCWSPDGKQCNESTDVGSQ